MPEFVRGTLGDCGDDMYHCCCGGFVGGEGADPGDGDCNAAVMIVGGDWKPSDGCCGDQC